MPPLSVRCACGKMIVVAHEHRGRTIKCGQCGRTMRVPEIDYALWLRILSWAHLAALVRNRAMLAPLALAALVAVVPVVGFRLGWQRLLSHPAGAHVRVVTLNADGGDWIAPRLARALDSA